jgi:hypothetical protein
MADQTESQGAQPRATAPRAPTGPAMIQLTRADTTKQHFMWFTVNDIILLHVTNPNTPPGTAIWIGPGQAFIVKETPSQIIQAMNAQITYVMPHSGEPQQVSADQIDKLFPTEREDAAPQAKEIQ